MQELEIARHIFRAKDSLMRDVPLVKLKALILK